MDRSTPDFTFAARDVGRHVYQPRRMPFWRCALIVAVMAVLGVWLMLATVGVAHAGTRDLQTAAENLNSQCRDNPKATGACAAREVVLAQLKTEGKCWNSRATTTADLWVRCGREGDGLGIATTVDTCSATGGVAYGLAVDRDKGLGPQRAYQIAVSSANMLGLDPGPLQAMTWRVFAELGDRAPLDIRRTAVYECRRARGLL